MAGNKFILILCLIFLSKKPLNHLQIPANLNNNNNKFKIKVNKVPIQLVRNLFNQNNSQLAPLIRL